MRVVQLRVLVAMTVVAVAMVVTLGARGEYTDRGVARAQTPTCNAGGTPSLRADFERHSDVVLLGCGRTPSERPVELVASRSSDGRCLTLRVGDRTSARQASSSFQECGGSPDLAPRVGELDVPYRFSGDRGGLVAGPSAGRVAEIRAIFRQRGRIRRSTGVLIRVTAELQARIGAPAPFGYFVVETPAGSQSVRLLAIDDAGRVVSAVRVALPGRCGERGAGCGSISSGG